MNQENDHSRTIIHIDLDCFYAQVEMVKNPALSNLPIGIQQKHIVVTSNYKAREFGIKKCMPISEAKKLCPNLVLVNGEDLHDYRQVSHKVTSLLKKYSNQVERLNLDENFIDVTKLVEERLQNEKPEIVGNVFGDVDQSLCNCGCYERLVIGTVIAEELRELIRNELKLTSCAGIAHNKLLAKVAGSQFKFNQQTVVFPNSALELMLSLNELTRIPGFGPATTDQLEIAFQVRTVKDYQSHDFSELKSVLGTDRALNLLNLTHGVDTSPVKTSGRPLSIGIENSCQCKIETEINEKLRQLLKRLLILVNEDGRVPRTVKLTIRRFDKNSKSNSRETRQCNFNSFNSSDKEAKIMSIIMSLFHRIVDHKKSYHITLLGLAFTKFNEPINKQQITYFFRNSLEVQLVTNIENEVGCEPKPSTTPSTSTTTPLASSTAECLLDESSTTEHCNKKIKFSINNNNLIGGFDDCSSPSKLRVADLSLSGAGGNDLIQRPPNADREVFSLLPRDIQKELWDDYKRERNKETKLCCSQVKKSKPNTLFNYFVKN